MSEESEVQRIAMAVGSMLAPRQDVVQACRGEFEDLVKEHEARREDRNEALEKAREAICSEWEAIAQGKKKALLTDGELQKPPKKGYRWFPTVMDVKTAYCLDTGLWRGKVLGGWVPADVYETLEHGLPVPPWRERDRPFSVRVMRLALLHDEALSEASHLLGPPENDSPPIALFRQDFRVHLSGVCKWGGVGEVFDHYRPNHELCMWDDDAHHGLQDDLERVRAELAERPKEAFGKNGGPVAPAIDKGRAGEDRRKRKRGGDNPPEQGNPASPAETGDGPATPAHSPEGQERRQSRPKVKMGGKRKKAPAASLESPSGKVKLFGPNKKPQVMGKPKRVLTEPEYETVKALLDAAGQKLTKDELDIKAGRCDARKHLYGLCQDKDWAKAVPLPGKHSRGYRIP